MHRNRDVFCVESDESLMSPREAFTPIHGKGGSRGGTVPATPGLSGYLDSRLGFTPIDTLDGQDKEGDDEPGEKEETVQWSWEFDQEDRKREAEADRTFKDYGVLQVERAVLKAVVKEKMGAEVVRIVFLSSGTFHKAYLITLSDKQQIVARVARRFMPRLKTESEVATMAYIGRYTDIPVPTVYHYDSSPYNRLGGEYILMSKAKGVPLATIYHSLSHHQLVQLFANLARLFIPLYAHRFPALGSLYFGAPTQASGALTGHSSSSLSSSLSPYPSQGASSGAASSVPGRLTSGSMSLSRNNSSGSSSNGLTPRPDSYVNLLAMTAATTPRASTSSHASPSTAHDRSSAGGFPFSKEIGHAKRGRGNSQGQTAADAVPFHVGPIISWPFFGSNRGSIPSSTPSSSTSSTTPSLPSVLIGSSTFAYSSSEPTLNRGPFSSTAAYLAACSAREIQAVSLENAGKAAPHRIHLDPDVVKSSYRHSFRTHGHADTGPSLGDRASAGNGPAQGSKRVRDGGGRGAGRHQAYPSVVGHGRASSAAPKGYDNGEDYDDSYPSSPTRSSFSSSESEDECGSDADESEEEWEVYRSVGDRTYRDYRRNQRGTFLVAHLDQREQKVRREMERWEALIGKMIEKISPKGTTGAKEEEFGLDCHDLSLENIFVDENDHTQISAIIDWESTTTRPLWQCAHLPAFLQSSPFAADLFTSIVKDMATPHEDNGDALAQPRPRTKSGTTEATLAPLTVEAASSTSDSPRSTTSSSTSTSPYAFSDAPTMSSRTSTSLSQGSSFTSSKPARFASTTVSQTATRSVPPSLAAEWLYYESAGMRLRMAHRFAEWDGWEEGLIDTMLGSEEQEGEWLAGLEDIAAWPSVLSTSTAGVNGDDTRVCLVTVPERGHGDTVGKEDVVEGMVEEGQFNAAVSPRVTTAIPFKAQETSRPKVQAPMNPLVSTHGPVIFKSRATRLPAVDCLAVTEEKEKTHMLNSTDRKSVV